MKKPDKPKIFLECRIQYTGFFGSIMFKNEKEYLIYKYQPFYKRIIRQFKGK